MCKNTYKKKTKNLLILFRRRVGLGRKRRKPGSIGKRSTLAVTVNNVCSLATVVFSCTCCSVLFVAL